MVERRLAKAKVAGSIPVSRSLLNVAQSLILQGFELFFYHFDNAPCCVLLRIIALPYIASAKRDTDCAALRCAQMYRRVVKISL